MCIETFLQEIGRGARDASLQLVASTLYNQEDLIEMYDPSWEWPFLVIIPSLPMALREITFIFCSIISFMKSSLLIFTYLRVLNPMQIYLLTTFSVFDCYSIVSVVMQCLDIAFITQTFDIPSEVLITLLVELDKLGVIRYLYKGYNTCTITAVRGTLAKVLDPFYALGIDSQLAHQGLGPTEGRGRITCHLQY